MTDNEFLANLQALAIASANEKAAEELRNWLHIDEFDEVFIVDDLEDLDITILQKDGKRR